MAWTGYYMSVKACAKIFTDATTAITNFVRPVDVFNDGGVNREYADCDIWDFGAIINPLNFNGIQCR